MPETAPKKVGRPKGTPGAIKNTVRIFATVTRATAEKLERIAKAQGFERRPGSTRPFFGGAIDALAAQVETKEPEYLRLARECNALRAN